ncbi:MAG TPA: HWE histidine kinase domain-containing protein [Aestuariivirga sp.]|nr:HWE histidine kinase domain-containing protein [Aestuariivirga sp.]
MAIAAGLLVLSFALRYFTPLNLPYLTFFPAIMLATFVAGRRAGLAVTFLAGVLAAFFFIAPSGTLALPAADAWGLGAFFVVGSIIVFVTGWLATAVTRLSEQSQRRLLAEEKTRVLMTELTHRMKNQYAVIQAMARATGKSAKSIPEFLDGFGQRLQGLARSHDLLVKSDWQGVSLKDLVALVLEPFVPETTALSRGPPIDINDLAVVNLGMALHELATNSSKHGAWSGHGKVRINWRLEQDRFVFEWSEADGPEVSKTPITGFGRTVLELIVPSALEGSGQLEFEPFGLHWMLSAPTEKIIAQSKLDNALLEEHPSGAKRPAPAQAGAL